MISASKMTIRVPVSRLAAVVVAVALFASACGGSDAVIDTAAPETGALAETGAPAEAGAAGGLEVVGSQAVSGQYCASYLAAIQLVGTDYETAVGELNVALSFISPDAPTEVVTYLSRVVDLANDSDSVEEFVGGRTPEITQFESNFDAYMEDNCGAADAATDTAAAVELAPRTELVRDATVPGRSFGFINENVLFEFVGLTATEVELASFFAGTQNVADTNYLLVEVMITGEDDDLTRSYEYVAADFTLGVADGAPEVAAVGLYIDGVETPNATFVGMDSVNLWIAFDTGERFANEGEVSFTFVHEDASEQGVFSGIRLRS